ncbi:MAG: lipid-A-disaccharide synthase [Campylobacterota bacterium]|nr:lipid-A-disaccharide synthase [Campylobacterota bacterium]
MKILVSALEHSANIHLKELHKHLKKDVELVGIFDSSLGDSIVDLRSLAIMGFVDAIKKLKFFLKLNKKMLDLSEDVDVVLLIDSSGFNLPLAKKIRKKYPSKKIIYYILPQAWAWKKKRIPTLAKTVTHLASILPFEPSYYASDAPIKYVGHPLLDEIKEFKTELTCNKTISFMPGSRVGEITKLMPIFRELSLKLQEYKLVLIIPPLFTQEKVDELYGDISSFTTSNNAHKTLYESEFAFICSGTATLESSLIGTPFILSYVAKKLDYFIASRLVKIKYLGLANIMYEKYKNDTIHPELIQDDVNSENLYNEFINYNKNEFLFKAKELRGYLKEGSSKNVAKLLELQ